MAKTVKGINPKDLIGLTKVRLDLFPPAGEIYGAIAMMDGAKKYDPYNWRIKKVRMMIYLAAIKRHVLGLLDGEDCAEDSNCPHLAHIISCAAILADAKETGNLVDDRPPKGCAAALLKKYQQYKKHSKRGKQ